MMTKGKTGKREVAVVLLLFLMWQSHLQNLELVETLVWPFMLYVGAAFGMEWARKQTTLTTQRYD